METCEPAARVLRHALCAQVLGHALCSRGLLHVSSSVGSACGSCLRPARGLAEKTHLFPS